MSPGAPANSLARIFFRRKAMLMRMLRVPTLAGHASGSGVDHAPVALAFTAEAIERRSLLARLCTGPAAREVAELSLHLRVSSIAPRPLRVRQ